MDCTLNTAQTRLGGVGANAFYQIFIKFLSNKIDEHTFIKFFSSNFDKI